MFGKPNPDGGPDYTAAMELVRFAFPRRTYTQSHVDYLLEVVLEVFDNRNNVTGYQITEQSNILRAFTARLLPV
jgi:Tryptophanase